MTRASLLVACALVASCYSPRFTDGQFTCTSSTLCPSGFGCVCGVCRADGIDAGGCGDLGTDLAGADLAGADLKVSEPCSNGNGQRAMGDWGLERAALCAAAWTAKGLNHANTPCTRMAGSDGKKGATECSAEDNCAAGWHVCLDDAEMTARGVTKTMCAAIPMGPLFVSRQRGAPTGMMQPPSCAQNMDRVIFGCGGFDTMGQNVSSCQIASYALIDPPQMVAPQTDECSTLSGGKWLCAGADMTTGEYTTVVKPGLLAGGVICCKDD